MTEEGMRRYLNYYKRSPVKSIRWNECDDPNVVEANRVNQKNAWVTDRVNVTGDRIGWTKMSKEEQEYFILTFVILSRIDAEQGLVGMDIIADNSPCKYTAAIFRYQAGMEIVHSESYNRQLSSFISTTEESKYIDWVNDSKEVNDVIGFLIQSMIDVEYTEESKEIAWLLQLAYSTTLESYLFYLLFYYPLYEANVKNRMTRCAEVIRLIMRDESVHGAFSGYTFKKYIQKETPETQEYIRVKVGEFMSDLYSRVEAMLRFVYKDEFIIADIQRFANFNFNRTLQNLGYDEVFTGEQVEFHSALESEVKNGINVTHDIFSMTGKTYFMMRGEEYTDKHREIVKNELGKRSKLLPKARRA